MCHASRTSDSFVEGLLTVPSLLNDSLLMMTELYDYNSLMMTEGMLT